MIPHLPHPLFIIKVSIYFVHISLLSLIDYQRWYLFVILSLMAQNYLSPIQEARQYLCGDGSQINCMARKIPHVADYVCVQIPPVKVHNLGFNFISYELQSCDETAVSSQVANCSHNDVCCQNRFNCV